MVFDPSEFEGLRFDRIYIKVNHLVDHKKRPGEKS